MCFSAVLSILCLLNKPPPSPLFSPSPCRRGARCQSCNPLFTVLQSIFSAEKNLQQSWILQLSAPVCQPPGKEVVNMKNDKHILKSCWKIYYLTDSPLHSPQPLQFLISDYILLTRFIDLTKFLFVCLIIKSKSNIFHYKIVKINFLSKVTVISLKMNT